MDDAYTVTAEELMNFVHRAEAIASEKADLAEQDKELSAEVKGRGYDSKVFRMVVARRKRKRQDLEEEESILQLYEDSLLK